MNNKKEENQNVFLLFESKTYKILIQDPNLTIFGLKISFCEELQNVGIFINHQFYQCSDFHCLRVFRGEEKIYDILKETKDSTIRFFQTGIIEQKSEIIMQKNAIQLQPQLEDQQHTKIVQNRKNGIDANIQQKCQQNKLGCKKECLDLQNPCLVTETQIKKELTKSQKKNVMFNLRIALETFNLREKSQFKMYPIKNSNYSRVFIIGPKNSPYSDGIYQLITNIPDEYPFTPPQLYFYTFIYHPNIINGEIALNEFEKSWTPDSKFESAIQIIINYMSQPNLKFTLDQECEQQYISDKDSFCQQAEEFKNKFANLEIDDIIKSLIGGGIQKSNPLYSEVLEDFEEWIINWVHK